MTARRAMMDAAIQALPPAQRALYNYQQAVNEFQTRKAAFDQYQSRAQEKGFHSLDAGGGLGRASGLFGKGYNPAYDAYAQAKAPVKPQIPDILKPTTPKPVPQKNSGTGAYTGAPGTGSGGAGAPSFLSGSPNLNRTRLLGY